MHGQPLHRIGLRMRADWLNIAAPRSRKSPMSLFNVLLIALLQGLTELFPVSSLGHAVLVPALLHLNINQHARDFLPFLVVLHVGTLLALLAYFWRVWLGIAWGVLRGPRAGDAENFRRLAGMLVLGTLPAIVVGFVLEKPLRALFAEPWVAALFLIVNGGMLLLGERLRRRAAQSASGALQDEHLDGLRWRDALLIGCWQCLAFIPGLSRSGATMVGSLRRGLEPCAGRAFFVSARRAGDHWCGGAGDPQIAAHARRACRAAGIDVAGRNRCRTCGAVQHLVPDALLPPS